MQDEALRVAVAVRVVDNFGDAGVAWRLARQLVAEHGCAVTLWIDAPAVLARFVHALDPAAHDADVDGVRIRRLPGTEVLDAALDPRTRLVVEAFGCGLPAGWLDAMAASRSPPAWIVLEHLSAEDWVEGTHALPSPHPSRALARWFWFPGFTPRTGGLLRERGLLAARDAFVASPRARERVFADAGLPAPPGDALLASLFCYATAALPALLRAWTLHERRIAAIVPEGVATEAIAAFAGRALRAGETIARGRLALSVARFVDQDAFDRRLWASDFALVRGEDSFVRAQWAAQPFAWHVYPQANDAHRAKLDAFLARFAGGLAPAVAGTLAAFTRSFVDGDGNGVAGTWPALAQRLPDLRRHGLARAASLAAQSDLASRLVAFARPRL